MAQEAAQAAPARNVASGRMGGIYVPRFKLKQMQDSLDRQGEEWQRIAWEALKKSINGLVNKVAANNIQQILPEVFGENLIRGRGLVCRSIMKAQLASMQFTNVYAALVAVINTKLPEVGELLLKRVVVQFRRSYKRNDKPVCMAMTTFIAHLVNQQVAHELLALQLLSLLLEKPTDDSVELAVAFVRECGATLLQVSPQGSNAIFERLRSILNDGSIDTRVQYLIEAVFVVRKTGFKEHPAVVPELDLVEESDIIMHELGLDDELEPEPLLDVFRMDPDYQENEDK